MQYPNQQQLGRDSTWFLQSLVRKGVQKSQKRRSQKAKFKKLRAKKQTRLDRAWLNGWEMKLADVLFQGFFNHVAVHIAHNLLLHLSTLEDQQRGNAAHAITLRGCRAAVHVHLSDLYFALICGRHFVHHGRQHLARAAPGCPEIDHDWLIAFKDLLVKIAISYFKNSHALHEVPTFD